MEVSGQLHAMAALSPGKEPLNLLDRRLGGPQSRCGCGGEEKNSQPPFFCIAISWRLKDFLIVVKDARLLLHVSIL
jgi:hypothetical protein